MLGLLFVHFFHPGAHTVILAAPTEETVGGIGAALTAGKLPADRFGRGGRRTSGRISETK